MIDKHTICTLCFVLCPLSFVLCALSFVLWALCFLCSIVQNKNIWNIACPCIATGLRALSGSPSRAIPLSRCAPFRAFALCVVLFAFCFVLYAFCFALCFLLFCCVLCAVLFVLCALCFVLYIFIYILYVCVCVFFYLYFSSFYKCRCGLLAVVCGCVGVHIYFRVGMGVFHLTWMVDWNVRGSIPPRVTCVCVCVCVCCWYWWCCRFVVDLLLLFLLICC